MMISMFWGHLSSQVPPSQCGRDTGCTDGVRMWLSPRILTAEFEREHGHFLRAEGVSHAAALITHEFGHLVFGHPYDTAGLPVAMKERQADCWASVFMDGSGGGA